MDDPPTTAATASASAVPAKLFLSYSRKDRSFVESLCEALKGRFEDIWVDLEDIRPSEDWLKAIHAAIESAHAVIFVVSPDSVDPASVCAQEIDHAIAHNKRIVPIVCRAVDTRVVRVPDAIGRLNWIPFSDAEGFDSLMPEIVSAIETDLEWLRHHTRLLERAVEWDVAKRDDSFLLRKNDLAAAEQWLALGPTKEPKPTALQTQYIVDSRTAAARRQRLVLGAVSAGLVITIALAIVAWLQRDEAVSQANISLARQLVAQSEVVRDERPDLLQRSVLLAVESLRRYPTLEADQFLRSVVPLLPRAVGGAMKHQEAVQAVAFSPDGAHLATASWDGTAGIWDAATGEALFTLKPGEAKQRVQSVAFNPNGALLVTADARGLAQVWNVASGQPLGQPMAFRPSQSNAAVFSADGNYVATMSEGGADIWRLDIDGKGNAKLFSTTAIIAETPCIPLSSFAFSPDGKHAAASCRGQTLIWSVDNWNRPFTIPYRIRPGLRPPLHPIAFSADGKYLASADEVYDVDARTLVRELHSPLPVSAVAFSRNADYVALAAGDAVRLVTMSDGAQFAEMNHSRAIRAIAFSPTGSELATAGEDNTARIWQVSPIREIARISHDGTVSSVAFHPDGKHIATGSEDGTARIWRVNAAPLVADRVFGRSATSEESVVAASSNGQFLAVERENIVVVMEAYDGREVGRVTIADGSDWRSEVGQASLSPDGGILWIAMNRINRGKRARRALQSQTRVWDVVSGKELTPIQYDKVPDGVIFTPDSKRLVADDNTTLQIWDVGGGREAARITHDLASEPPVISSDGAWLALIEPKSIRILETNGLREVRSLPIGETTFRVVAFSPDGKQVASGNNETVEIWDVAGSATSRKLPIKYATAILFSPDSKQIVIANWNFYDPSDRSVRIWDAVRLREIDRLPLLDIERTAYVSHSDTRLTLSADGRRLAIESQGIVRVWDMLTHRETQRWESGYTTQVRFSRDGKHLLSITGTIASVWSLGPEWMIAEACKRLARNLNPAEWRQYLSDVPNRQTCTAIDRTEVGETPEDARPPSGPVLSPNERARDPGLRRRGRPGSLLAILSILKVVH